ncbi:unnamed protein product [Dovyalis caffra]|uniref:Uncharacterized protein n=1 Tax=Dovyalis caffra TaxID=77055 RepID=A0AAV1SG59_9ROSI|nr:unnamed protein product [Dovyalis caffra]
MASLLQQRLNLEESVFKHGHNTPDAAKEKGNNYATTLISDVAGKEKPEDMKIVERKEVSAGHTAVLDRNVVSKNCDLGEARLKIDTQR